VVRLLAPVRAVSVSWLCCFQSMICGCDGNVGIDRGEKEKAVSSRGGVNNALPPCDSDLLLLPSCQVSVHRVSCLGGDPLTRF
jgi:hypothetical protein